MKKTIILIAILALSCNDVSKESKNTSYSINEDTNDLVNLINDKIEKKESPYFQGFYDSKTEVIIDTILYNSKNNKLAFFVISKVENKKRYPKGISDEQAQNLEMLGNLPYKGYHYNGHAFIARRNNDDFIIKDFSVINIEKYKSIEKIKGKLRKTFFKDYSNINEKGYEYNLNEKGFWDNKNVWESF